MARQELIRCAIAPMLLLAAAPALAQADPLTELDALSSESGLAQAQSLGASGDLLGALGALDRVLMAQPDARPALLLRAQLLCRIDDKPGGSAQLARLKKRDYPRADWQAASQACAGAKASASTPTSQRSERWNRPGF